MRWQQKVLVGGLLVGCLVLTVVFWTQQGDRVVHAMAGKCDQKGNMVGRDEALLVAEGSVTLEPNERLVTVFHYTGGGSQYCIVTEDTVGHKAIMRVYVNTCARVR